MNREIKFRAWDIESAKMITPDNSLGEYVFDFIDGEIRVKTEETQWREGGGETYEVEAWVECNVELMQYTGLIEEGEEIWEGDVLEYYNGYMTPVFFLAGSFMIFINEGQYIELSQTSGFPKRGNIFETPDLLKPGMLDRMNKLVTSTEED